MITRIPRDSRRFLEILNATKLPVCLTIINPENEYVIYPLQIQSQKQLEALLDKRHIIIERFKHCEGVVEYVNKSREPIGEMLKWK